MPCEKRVSTENGVLQCDKKPGHVGMHHATHPGGLVPAYDQRRDPTNLSPFKNDRGESVQAENVQGLEIEWPQEGMNDPVKITRPSP